MQIRKTYQNINPTILYDEVREFIQRQGITLSQNRLDTYSIPTDSSSFIYRGTLAFNVQGKEALRVQFIGTDKGETKVMLDSVDALFPTEKVAALEDDLSFMLSSYEQRGEG